MAVINKASMVLLMLFVVATISDAARFDSSLQLIKHSESEIISQCACYKQSGVEKCVRFDREMGGCPAACGEACTCTESDPPTCFCDYEVDSCSDATWAIGFKDFVIRGHMKP